MKREYEVIISESGAVIHTFGPFVMPPLAMSVVRDWRKEVGKTKPIYWRYQGDKAIAQDDQHAYVLREREAA